MALLAALGLVQPVRAQDATSTNAPPRALPVTPAELAPPNSPAALGEAAPVAIPGGVNIHWYGHGFVFLTSSVGVRAAIDPFGHDTVHYTFPPHLTADFVLVTHEAEDSGAADELFGNPLIFRSVTAVGLNRANGISFHGTALAPDPSGQGGANTAFTLEFDGVTFGYLGKISQPLSDLERDQMGPVDVLFLPVGLTSLSVKDLNATALALQAKVIIPIEYKTLYSGDLPLRGLDEYLEDTHFPVRRFESPEIAVTHDTLPSEPTVYVLTSPKPIPSASPADQ